jgi:hypothetical protein
MTNPIFVDCGLAVVFLGIAPVLLEPPVPPEDSGVEEAGGRVVDPGG